VKGDADHVERNRAAWNGWAPEYVAFGERAWASAEPSWGVWSVPEADLHVLPDDLDGKDTIELGCGTAYVSAWLARRGALPVGIDISNGQLATARRLQVEHGVDFPLVEASAERLPFPDASFDFAISEYGACLWADPYAWVPEAARVLRPGGRLIFLTNGAIMMLCVPDDEDDPLPRDRLLRDYFGLNKLEWAGQPSVEFHLGYGDWIRLLRANGFEIEDLVEVRPPAGSTTTFDVVTIDWARRWPCEEVWKARKRD
jgi:SAM-dependent methyltransferase